MNIYVPSIKKAHINKTLTAEFIGFAAFICTFIVPLFVILGQDLLKDTFKILFTYISLNRVLVLSFTVTLLLILFGINTRNYINKMTTSYIIGKDTIVKAKLKSDKNLLKINKLI